MIIAIDFSEYELNGKYYGGSERKEEKMSFQFLLVNVLLQEIEKIYGIY